MMTAESFKDSSEGAFALFKIVALIAVGWWTVLEWNTTIFPRESHEQMIRAAEKRTDLDATNATLAVGSVREIEATGANQQQETAEGTSGENEITVTPTNNVSAAMAQLDLRNPTKFPIQMTIRSAQLSIADVDSSDGALQWKNLEIPSIPHAFGPGLDQPRTIESNRTARLSFLHMMKVSWCCDSYREEFKLARLVIELELAGVDPKTSELERNPISLHRIRRLRSSCGILLV